MPSITIKNIPDNIYSKIKENAAKNFRSINGEILYCLNRVLENNINDSDKLISLVEELQSRIETSKHK